MSTRGWISAVQSRSTISSCVRTEYADETWLHMKTRTRMLATRNASRRHSPKLAPADVRWSRMRLNASQYEQDDNNEDYQTQTAGRGVTPFPAVGPAWQRSNQRQNQNHDQNSCKHVLLPFSFATRGKGAGRKRPRLNR